MSSPIMLNYDVKPIIRKKDGVVIVPTPLHCCRVLVVWKGSQQEQKGTSTSFPLKKESCRGNDTNCS